MVVSIGELALVLADTMKFTRENPSGMFQSSSLYIMASKMSRSEFLARKSGRPHRQGIS